MKPKHNRKKEDRQEIEANKYNIKSNGRRRKTKELETMKIVKKKKWKKIKRCKK